MLVLERRISLSNGRKWQAGTSEIEEQYRPETKKDISAKQNLKAQFAKSTEPAIEEAN